jgi:hypothetical protein
VVRVERGYYYCDHCRGTHIPWDDRQGLSSRMWTPRVKELVASLCAVLPYEQASKLLMRISGLSIEESCAEQIVADVGKALRREEAEAIVSAVDTDWRAYCTEKETRMVSGGLHRTVTSLGRKARRASSRQ